MCDYEYVSANRKCNSRAVFPPPQSYLEWMWQSARLITPSCPTKMAQKNVLAGKKKGGEDEEMLT